MRRNLAATIVAAQILATVAGAQVDTNKAFNLRIYGLAEQFEWKESADGQRLVTETGPLFGAGGEIAFRLAAPIWLRGCGEVFFGDVDYDGFIQTSEGDLIPSKTATTYSGFKADGTVELWLHGARGSYLKPYAGLGCRAWRRTLDTEAFDKYIGALGYTEDWMTLYGILGLGGGVAVGKTVELFGRAEARMAIENAMEADLSNVRGPSDIDVKPGKRPSASLEVGLSMAPITASVFAETLEFSESALDGEYDIFLQPESKATMIGARIGVVF